MQFYLPVAITFQDVETAGNKIPGRCYLVEEISRMDNPFHFRRKGLRALEKEYEILKDRRRPREETPTLNHIKSNTV